MVKHKTKSAAYMEYFVRQTKRFGFILVGLFVLFVLIMVIVWAVPKIWHWAIG